MTGKPVSEVARRLWFLCGQVHVLAVRAELGAPIGDRDLQFITKSLKDVKDAHRSEEGG